MLTARLKGPAHCTDKGAADHVVVDGGLVECCVFRPEVGGGQSVDVGRLDGGGDVLEVERHRVVGVLMRHLDEAVNG